jgi:uncharacterized membrane protein
MKFNFKKELPLILITATPFLYLIYIWNSLPQKVPMHWNLQGEIDRYGSKSELWLIPLMLPLLTYLLFVLIPYIDPKGKIEKMGQKYHSLKFILTLSMSVLAIFIIYSAKSKSLTNPNYVIALIGVLYLVIGNYFKTVKPNYFIGIRTPWTLENENIWKSTHQLAGKMWFIAGLCIVILSFILTQKINFILFILLTSVITIIPILHSFLEFKKHQK